MVTQDAQNKALTARRDKTSCYDESHENEYSRFGRISEDSRLESLGVCRDGWEGTNTTSDSGAGTPGKMFKQLIEEVTKEIEESKKRTEKLQQHLSNLETLSREVLGELEDSK